LSSCWFQVVFPPDLNRREIEGRRRRKSLEKSKATGRSAGVARRAETEILRPSCSVLDRGAEVGKGARDGRGESTAEKSERNSIHIKNLKGKEKGRRKTGEEGRKANTKAERQDIGEVLLRLLWNS